MRQDLAGALAAAALVAVAAPAARAASPSPTQAFTDLVRLYARGERAEAIAGLGAWREHELGRVIAEIGQAARAAERCPACPSDLDGFPLRAAIMLLWDRDRADRPADDSVEQPRLDPGPHARLAGRLARVAARRAASAAFARRFFRMVVLSCQWDARFGAAERWADEAIEVFPRDVALLLARGSVREESAALGVSLPSAAQPGDMGFPDSAAAAARQEALRRARRDFEDALAIDPAHALVRVRLGRVLWRLDEPERAREELQAALASERLAGHAYLAHLFLGRVHQDAGRLAEASVEYRAALSLHPTALAAGLALSNALLLQGDAEGARLAVRHAVRQAGRRTQRDAYWDYQVVNAADLSTLLDELHRESLE